MKKLLFLTLICTGTSFAQVNFSLNPEIGYSYGGKGKNESIVTAHRQDRIDKSLTHKSGFLVGLQGNFTFRRFFCFSAGLQYQEKGSTYTENRQSPGITNGIAYNSQEKNIQRFKKFCLPLSAGFTFKIWQFQPAVFAGIRPNYFFHGRYYSHSTFDAADPTKDYSHASSYNPLETNKWGAIRNQHFYGISVLCFDRLKVSFTVNKGPAFVYSFGPMSCYGTSLDNNDYIFSLSWFCRKNTVCTWPGLYKTVRFL